MPIKWRSKILLAKIETAYGTDPTPAAATDAILAVDVKLSPMEGSDVGRDLELPYLGAQGTIPTEVHAKIGFKVELAPSGTAGTAPRWGVLLRGCGVAQTISTGTSVTYNPVSDNHESLTFHLWIGGTRYAIIGARGDATFTVNAQGIPQIEFEFTGLFTMPAEVSRPASPSLSAFQTPQVATTANTPTFTIGGTPFVMRSFKFAMGNAVERRFLIGAEAILITDRSESIETTVEAVPLTTFNPFDRAASAVPVPLTLAHGRSAGRIATLAFPTTQLQRPQGLENAQNIKEWPLRMAPLPATGNDQWTLTLT